MDGFTGYRTATMEALTDATPVMDPFHVVQLAGRAVDEIRRRLQHAYFGHRGRKGEPLYRARRWLLTRVGLLTPSRLKAVEELLDNPDYADLDAAHLIYQRIITAYDQHKDRNLGKFVLDDVIKQIKSIPEKIPEPQRLGRTLRRKWPEISAFFTFQVSNAAVEAINGRLKSLRRIALGFRNIYHYIFKVPPPHRTTQRPTTLTLESVEPLNKSQPS